MRPLWKRRSVTPARRLIIDMLHFASKVPLCPCERYVRLAEVEQARSRAPIRISQSLVFLKAAAIVAREVPQLRQLYYDFPWPSTYEHPHTVGMMAIEREQDDERYLCFGRFLEPESTSLVDLQERLEFYLDYPMDVAFRKQMMLARLPWSLRRFLLWLTLIGTGPLRAKRVGTLGLSTLAGRGAWNRGHPTITSASLSYGPMDERGGSLVTLIFDHRVFDGGLAAYILERLEQVLATTIREELLSIQTVDSRAA